MEPRIIPMIIPPQDIIGELINRRVQKLEQKYPDFHQEFNQLQRKVKEHHQNLKKRNDMTEQLFAKVMEELQLKEYNLDSSQHSPQQHKQGKYKKVIGKEEHASLSNRSSYITEGSFKPYRIGSFKKQMNHLNLKF